MLQTGRSMGSSLGTRYEGIDRWARGKGGQCAGDITPDGLCVVHGDGVSAVRSGAAAAPRGPVTNMCM